MLSKATYDEIRAQLSFEPSLSLLTLTLSGHLAWVASALWLSLQASTSLYLCGQVLLAVAFFQAFCLLHDAGHGNCTKSRIGNVIIGHCASLLCFLPFYPWKYLHAEHHVWTGNPERDPGLAIVKRAQDTRQLPWLLRASFRVYVPLGGVSQHLVYWAYPWTAKHRAALSRGRAWRCFGSSLLLLGCYASLALLAPAIVSWRTLGLASVMYLLMVEFVNLPHHVGLTTYTTKLPLWQQHLPTRSCNYPPVVSELLVLNFNFHIEHHLYPTLPWYRLRAARRLVKAALGDGYRETVGSEWHQRERKRDMVDVLTGGPSAD